MKYKATLLLAVCLVASPLWASGGGENMLLVVNPNDENAIRVANAYARIRQIPDRNIIFHAPPRSGGYTRLWLNVDQMKDNYITPLTNTIRQRGLSNVDYIGLIGQSTSFSPTSNYTKAYRWSITHALSRLDAHADGLAMDAKYIDDPKRYQLAANTPNNTPLRHSQTHTEFFKVGSNQVTVAMNYTMAGMAGFTGFMGNTPDQVINSLERTAAGDGTKPQGRIYFVDSGDIRSVTRRSQWPITSAKLDARGIPYFLEQFTGNSSPKNRHDVRGAVTGAPWLTLPNGSTYLPGSWADNLTSFGATFDDRSQIKTTAFIASGAGGSSGTVTEPFATDTKFPHSDIHVHIADGSTHGEAFTKTVKDHTAITFMGDMLAQPYADVPKVTLTGIDTTQKVKGNITLQAAASLNNPTLATGIKQLQLYVNGKAIGSPLSNATGSFNLDTTQLSDGRHELRVVALNNAKAESSGSSRMIIDVNNRERSVAAAGDLTLNAKQVAPLSVTAHQGDGSVSRIELRHMGRTLGSLNAASGNINLDAAKLAYGDNPIVPVAIYSDGSEVMGASINVKRNPDWLPGRAVTPSALRVPGVKAEFFNGIGTTIPQTRFHDNPDRVTQFNQLNLFSGRSGKTQLGSSATSMGIDAAGLDLDKLAVRLTARFNITSDKAGEYQFYFYYTNDSAQLLIDGQSVLMFNNSYYANSTAHVPSLFLAAGEHNLTVLATNVITGGNADYFDISLMYRGPDGITRMADSNFLYTAIPEPTSLSLLGLMAMLTLRRCPRLKEPITL